MLSIRTESPEGAKRPQTGVITPGIVTHYPEALKGRKMVFHAFSIPFVWIQYKRGLSSPPVFSPAFQASVGQSVFSPFFIFLLCSSSRNQGGNLVWKWGLVPTIAWPRLIFSQDFLKDFLPQAIKLGRTELFLIRFPLWFLAQAIKHV